ncbi:hypothetical protein EST38_g7707 [Candolleomyces aberdarensis]|uniref:Epoxide hydrolase N-terminal domain-containing protein n=1 Tax=Candolleomyces aberdarensis TaxID=2316362 RepID=A0A4Q2DG96_9AGAR|nr:hypothetical protein EST38_g7707 [Candolleomyces aberdarensis]
MSRTLNSEKPFQISIPSSDLTLLQQKLELVRLAHEVDNAGWDYGVPLSEIKRLTAYWKDTFLPKWRDHEAKLNEDLGPQFTRDIEVDGGFGKINVHHVHRKSAVVDAVPLLFVHGWPGSVLEVKKILPLLVEESPDHPSFHVVAVSLPGYGFSEAPQKKGFEAVQMAEVCNKLMLSLGYTEYVTQGGDMGSLVTRKIAQIYGPKHSKAWHTNSPMYVFILTVDMDFNAHYITLNAVESPHILSSVPYSCSPIFYSAILQTLGYSLDDSPVGLLAWIYEKLVNWSDGYSWTDDEVLTWISVYWFSKSGPAASTRIYYELAQAYPEGIFSGVQTPIPVGHSYFPKDIFVVPRRWIKAANPTLAFESDHEGGGHFAAHERPEELVSDLRRMFGKGGPCYGVVPGKTGY